MNVVLFIIAALILVGALATVCVRNLVYCALSLAATFAALGMLYLALGAEFIGWVQILVYVGAVAVLIVFVILLTAPDRMRSVGPLFSRSRILGVGVSLGVFGTIAYAVHKSGSLKGSLSMPAETDMQSIGEELLSSYLVPLEATGVLLTVALIGAVLFAREEPVEGSEESQESKD